jgi:hypothetical protein
MNGAIIGAQVRRPYGTGADFSYLLTPGKPEPNSSHEDTKAQRHVPISWRLCALV